MTFSELGLLETDPEVGSDYFQFQSNSTKINFEDHENGMLNIAKIFFYMIEVFYVHRV